MKKIHQFSSDNIIKYLEDKKEIFDIGTGPKGSYWWNWIDKDAKITGIDLYFFPKKIPNNVKIYKFDASELKNIKDNINVTRYRGGIIRKFIKEETDWKNNFDLIVANHILEHVSSYEDTIAGIAKLSKMGTIVYTGFPDANNFTDIFYHLIHPEGGGHIQKLTKEKVHKAFEENGFKLLECNIWPDDWLWFEKMYDYKQRNITFITQKDIDYMCKVFRKELTSEKGYFYGWEMVFQKL